MKYSKTGLKDFFGSTFYQRGADYYARAMVKSVEQLNETSDPLVLHSRVQGSHNKIYDQTITIYGDKRGVDFDGQCSCPMYGNCKHVVAVLLAWLDRSQQPMSEPSKDQASVTLSHDLNCLIDELSKAVEKDAPDYNSETYPAHIRNRLVYWLNLETSVRGTTIVCVEYRKISLLKDGSIGKQCSRYNSENIAYGLGPKFLRPSDYAIFDELRQAHRQTYNVSNYFKEKISGQLLEKLLATGRCYWVDHREFPCPLSKAPEAQSTAHWIADTTGAQKFTLNVPDHPNAIILGLNPPWFYNRETNQCGPLQTDISPTLCEVLLRAPAINVREIAPFLKALDARLKNASIPLPQAPSNSKISRIKPKPLITLKLMTLKSNDTYGWGRNQSTFEVPVAAVDFIYNKLQVFPDDARQELETLEDDTITLIPRDFKAERRALNTIEHLDLDLLSDEYEIQVPRSLENALYVVDDYHLGMNWLEFMHTDLPDLQQKGWIVDISNDFPVSLASEPEHWSLGFENRDNDWFGLSLGVTIDGKLVDLLPALLSMFDHVPEGFSEVGLDFLLFDQDDSTFLPLGDGKFISVSAERIRPLLQNLFELFHDKTADPNKISRYHLNDIAALEQAAIQSGAIIKGAKDLRDLARKLTGGAKVRNIPPP